MKKIFCAIIAPFAWLFDHFCNAVSWVVHQAICWPILAVSLSYEVGRILIDELLHGRARRKRIEAILGPDWDRKRTEVL
jgi:hypothetical protein